MFFDYADMNQGIVGNMAELGITESFSVKRQVSSSTLIRFVVATVLFCNLFNLLCLPLRCLFLHLRLLR